MMMETIENEELLKPDAIISSAYKTLNLFYDMFLYG